ncbi:hypothetical protein CHS0354_013871 [Potamilus streckersoni]|uniref:protein-tyrosine-phosphatase n=1 Tax=Potamilus streckersoni TaxID=2493646 RepID=A0AAE0TAC1_9BIVA|nr:hypothetical protein CHS0354_013871 [Potamilus streckersoni]
MSTVAVNAVNLFSIRSTGFSGFVTGTMLSSRATTKITSISLLSFVLLMNHSCLVMAAVGSNCTDSNCTALGEICDSSSNLCTCNKGYTAVSTICKADLNSACNVSIDCRDTNAVCSNATHTCQCNAGYTNVNGACKAVTLLQVKNVTVVEIGEEFLKLQWENPEDVVDISKFEVTWQHQNLSFHLDVSKTLTAVLQSLIPGAVYSIEVASYINTEAKATYILQQATKPSRPGPINFSGSDLDLDGGFVIIIWSYNGSTNGVRLLFLVALKDNSTSQMVGGNLQSDTTSVNISSNGLKNGYRYSVSITAQSEQYNSSSVLLRERSGTYTELIKTVAKAPGPPSGLKCGQTDNDSIMITWNVPANPNGDIVQYMVETYNASGDRLGSKNTNSQSTSFHVDGLHPGSGYRFKVFTHNEITIETTGTSSGICYTNSQMSEAPTNLQASEITSRSLTVNWSKPRDVFGELLGYVLKITKTENDLCVMEELSKCSSGCNLAFPFHVVVDCANGLNSSKNVEAIKLVGAQSYTDMIFDPDTAYTVTVAAVNQGSKGYPAKVNVTTKEEAPQKPYNLTVVNITSKEATVAWNIKGPRPGQTKYNIRLVADKVAQLNLTVIGFSNTSCQLTGLEEFWDYSVIVEARTNLESNMSDPFPFKTKIGPAGKVRNCEVRKGSGGDMFVTAKVSWNLPEILQRNGPINSFMVQQEEMIDSTFKMIKSSNVLVVTIDDDHTYIQDFQVQPEKQYRFSVSALNGFIQPGEACRMNYTAPAAPVEPTNVSVGALVGGIVGGVVATAIVIAVVVFILRRKSGKSKKAKSTKKKKEFPVIKKERPIHLANFAEYVETYHKDGNLKFCAEYEDLKTLSPKHPHKAANLEENHQKNRFYNILPFDHSRVKLLSIDDVPGSDYINACYLQGFTNSREYIACQGPIPSTIEDHWRLIWEQNVQVIVMLTEYKEKGIIKCEPYIPLDLTDTKQYGKLVVECLTFSSMNSFKYRTLKVTLGEKERTIKHFHFLIWPDLSADVPLDIIIDFIKEIRTFIQPPDLEGPMIVHCSAGVGRTGTFIAIDSMIQYIDKHGPDTTVDIFNFVLKMRENRTSMVQTEEQYIFIHDCIKEYLNRLKTYENEAFSIDDEHLYQNTNVQLYENVNINSNQNTEL